MTSNSLMEQNILKAGKVAMAGIKRCNIGTEDCWKQISVPVAYKCAYKIKDMGKDSFGCY